MISNDTINQVIARMDIVEVVSSYMSIKKKGANYTGHCPFTSEKTPSFTVSPTKQIYKCFGCGKSGNAVTFIMEHEGMSYPMAIRALAERYNIEVQENYSSPEEQQRHSAREEIQISSKAAHQFFRDNLQHAAHYLKERNISDQAAETFQLGYNPGSVDGLVNTLRHKQFSDQSMIRAGLATANGGRLYDFFRERVMFPIQNAHGQIMGFAGRILRANDQRPKYINTPDNELYSKKTLLYGLFQARAAIAAQDLVVMTEGYLDVISLYQAGIENVVATCGTSITDEHLKLIGRFTKNVLLIYDGDNAGLKAVLRKLHDFMAAGFNVHVVILPAKHDPDSYVNLVGKDGFLAYMAETQMDLVEFYARTYNLALPEIKDATYKELVNLISAISSTEHYFRKKALFEKLSKVYDIPMHLLLPALNAPDAIAASVPVPESIQTDDTDTLQKLELELIRCLLLYCDRPYENKFVFTHVMDILKEAMEENYQPGHVAAHIYNVFYVFLEDGAMPDTDQFLHSEDPAIVSYAASILMGNNDQEPTVLDKRFEIPYTEEVKKALGFFHLEYTRRQLTINRERARTGEDGWTQELADRIEMELKKRIRNQVKELGLSNSRLIF